MQRRLCEMSEAKWSITEAKCLQRQHNKYASQRDAISYSMGNLMLSHSAGMHNTDKSIAGISKRFHFASLHYIFSAYLPTHIKFLTEFRCIFFRTTCISFPKFEVTSIGDATSCYIAVKTIKEKAAPYIGTALLFLSEGLIFRFILLLRRALLRLGDR